MATKYLGCTPPKINESNLKNDALEDVVFSHLPGGPEDSQVSSRSSGV